MGLRPGPRSPWRRDPGIIRLLTTAHLLEWCFQKASGEGQCVLTKGRRPLAECGSPVRDQLVPPFLPVQGSERTNTCGPVALLIKPLVCLPSCRTRLHGQAHPLWASRSLPAPFFAGQGADEETESQPCGLPCTGRAAALGQTDRMLRTEAQHPPAEVKPGLSVRDPHPALDSLQPWSAYPYGGAPSHAVAPPRSGLQAMLPTQLVQWGSLALLTGLPTWQSSSVPGGARESLRRHPSSPGNHGL